VDAGTAADGVAIRAVTHLRVHLARLRHSVLHDLSFAGGDELGRELTLAEPRT
jgi:hypothetical protein